MRHRVFKRGSIWYADFTDARTGKRLWRSLGTSSKGMADAKLAKIVTETHERGFFEDKRAPQVALKDFVAVYVEWARANKRSWDYDALTLRRFVAEWGDQLLSEITPHMIEQWKARRVQQPRQNSRDASKLVSRNAVNHELGVLKAAYNKAVLWGKALSNPVKGVKPFAVDDQRTLYLDRNQVQALLAACESRTAPHLRPLVLLALNTGMRRGEMLKLRWADVDYKAGVIHVRGETSKTGRGRPVPMNEGAMDALRACVAVERLAGASPSSPFVFCNAAGEPYGDVKTGFNRAKRQAGLPWLHLHDLRHTFASHLVSSGVDLAVIRELLGHSTLAMTIRYAHVAPTRKVQAVARLGSLYGSPADSPASVRVGSGLDAGTSGGKSPDPVSE